MTHGRSPARVVVGVDGSATSLAAAELGAWEARRRQVPLHLVHGCQGEQWYSPFQVTTHNPDLSGLDDAQAMLRNAAEDVMAHHAGLSVMTELIVGSGANAVVRESAGASLVVVGSRGGGGFARLLIGSVAIEVSVHASCPVIVVRPPIDEAAADSAALDPAALARISSAGPVVVGVDGSVSSEAALEFAFDEAASRKTPLVAANAWFGNALEDLDADNPRVRAEAEARSHALLSEATAGWRGKYPSVDVELRAVHDINPVWSLVRASRDASLLVVGSRGRGGFTSLLLGSVGHGLIAHAECPVAIVHQPLAGKAQSS